MATTRRRITQDDVRGVCKTRDAWWVIAFSDPLSIRVLPFLMRFEWITPNALTGFSIVVALISGGVFLWGQPIIGAVLFEIARFADNLDGKVARLRGTSSLVGGFFDIAGDLIRMVWVYSAVGIWLASRHEIPRDVALLPAVVVLVWLWSNAQIALKGVNVSTASPPMAQAAAAAPASAGGWTARHRMNRFPGSIDAAGVALTIAPLTDQPIVMTIVLWVVCGAFYFTAALRNVAKVFSVLRVRDAAARAQAAGSGGDATDADHEALQPRRNDLC
jgi:phosphatidylglycerophosphate synthase